MSAPVAGTALGWARGRTGRESLRQGKRGAHVGTGTRDTLSKLRTVRKLEGVYLFHHIETQKKNVRSVVFDINFADNPPD